MSQRVRQRVVRAVQSLGYEPNEVARSLRVGRTNAIAVLFPQVANAFFGHALQQIEQEASAYNQSVLLLSHGEDHVKQSRQLSTARRSHVDGILLIAAPGTNLTQLQAELGDIPVVALDRPLWESADYVGLRHAEAAEMATRHLLQHGYRRVACVTALPQVFSFQERITGYSKALAAVHHDGQIITAQNYTTLTQQVLDACQSSEPPDAVLTLSHMASVAAFNAIHRLRREKSATPAILGFDDLELGSQVRPAISIVLQPVEQMIHSAMDLLMDRIFNGTHSAPQRVELSATLILRDSCGCNFES